MFCNACGAQVQPDYRVCPKCGTMLAVSGAIVAGTRLQRHLNSLGIMWIAIGALFLLPSFVLLGIGSFLHVNLPWPNEMAGFLGPFVMWLIGSSLLLMGAGGILVGWGLMQHQPWARVTAIVLGVLSLFHPPFGTAMGIYTLWVLVGDNAGVEYRRIATA